MLRCKWTFDVLGRIRGGVNRPGQIVRSISGLSTKVLNQRLARLVKYGVLKKVSYPERPARVEYFLTPFGTRLETVFDAIQALQRELDREHVNPRRRRAAARRPSKP